MKKWRREKEKEEGRERRRRRRGEEERQAEIRVTDNYWAVVTRYGISK